MALFYLNVWVIGFVRSRQFYRGVIFKSFSIKKWAERPFFILRHRTDYSIQAISY